MPPSYRRNISGTNASAISDASIRRQGAEGLNRSSSPTSEAGVDMNRLTSSQGDFNAKEAENVKEWGNLGSLCNTEAFRHIPYSNSSTHAKQKREDTTPPVCYSTSARAIQKNENGMQGNPPSLIAPSNPMHADLGRVGAGLENMGNTCYMNTILQMLTHTKEFVSRIKEHYMTVKRMSQIHKVGALVIEGLFRDFKQDCMLCLLHNHFKSTFEKSGRSYRPALIHESLDRIGPEFVLYRQEDAHEFLRLLLDRCDIKNDDSVEEVFSGSICTTVTCSLCHRSSRRNDPIQDISLEIDESSIITVENALEKFTSKEIIDGKNAYNCELCNNKVKAEKSIKLTAIPNVLVVQLKRFKVQAKITKHIRFTEYLDLHVENKNSRTNITAQLYCVIVHTGFSKNSGHYFCYILGDDGIWRIFDDSTVHVVEWEEVEKANAYMLIYKKCSSNMDNEGRTSVSCTTEQKTKKRHIGVSHALLLAKNLGSSICNASKKKHKLTTIPSDASLNIRNPGEVETANKSVGMQALAAYD